MAFHSPVTRRRGRNGGAGDSFRARRALNIPRRAFTPQRRAFTPQRSAFTLVEALVAAAVLSILVFGVATELSAANEQTYSLQQNATALTLGRQLLEEIVAKPLANPTTLSTTPTAVALSVPRSQFVAVGDYNLYSDTGSALSTLGGLTVDASDGLNYTRSVTVTLGAIPNGDTASPSTDFALVTVTVKTPAGNSIQLQRVVTNYTFTR